MSSSPMMKLKTACNEIKGSSKSPLLAVLGGSNHKPRRSKHGNVNRFFWINALTEVEIEANCEAVKEERGA
ncbi:hypothetical protein AC1031_013478 [Aphanomyces cochlioides]|nr:hypothetical protein AC1031_013478 [Aphanomyces cochlioides]